MDQLSILTQGMTFKWNNNEFDLNPMTISMLHHWNFGTTASYYRNKNKFINLPNTRGEIVKITDVEGALNQAFATYNELTEMKRNDGLR